MPTISLDSLKSAAADTLVAELNTLIAGANADLQSFAVAIASDTVEAAAEGRTDLLGALADQTKVLLEANRIRIVAGAETAAMGIVKSVLSLAVRLVIPTIPQL